MNHRKSPDRCWSWSGDGNQSGRRPRIGRSVVEDAVVESQEQPRDRVQEELDEREEELHGDEEGGADHRVRRDRQQEQEPAQRSQHGDRPLGGGGVAQDGRHRREEDEEDHTRERRREDGIAEHPGRPGPRGPVDASPAAGPSATRASAMGRPRLTRAGTTKSSRAIRVVKAQRRSVLSAPEEPERDDGVRAQAEHQVGERESDGPAVTARAQGEDSAEVKRGGDQEQCGGGGIERPGSEEDGEGWRGDS